MWSLLLTGLPGIVRALNDAPAVPEPAAGAAFAEDSEFNA